MPLKVTASRFAVLQDDDPSDWNDPSKKKKPPQPQLKSKPVKNKKKTKASDEDRELRLDAFGLGKTKSKNKKASVKNAHSGGAAPKDDRQFEDWKQHDDRVVDETFERDIQDALIMSKVQLEQDQLLRDQVAQEKQEKKAIEAKRKPMSLGEFNQMTETSLTAVAAPATNCHKDNSESSDFFQGIVNDAQKIVLKEKTVESIKKMHLDYAMQMAEENREKNALAEKDAEISRLKSENETLASELKKVKTRYKTIRSILDQCEIKEKAEIVAEVIKLRMVRDEMVEEVKTLSVELEQNKTKVVTLEKQLKQSDKVMSHIHR